MCGGGVVSGGNEGARCHDLRLALSQCGSLMINYMVQRARKFSQILLHIINIIIILYSNIRWVKEEGEGEAPATTTNRSNPTESPPRDSEACGADDHPGRGINK